MLWTFDNNSVVQLLKGVYCHSFIWIIYSWMCLRVLISIKFMMIKLQWMITASI